VGNTGSTFVHVWDDFDRDGFLDLLVANGITRDGSTNRLYHNNGDGSFTDITEAAGLSEVPGIRTIGLTAGDYDLDGWPDIFVNSWSSQNRLYHNRGDGTFEEVAQKAGISGANHPHSGYLGFIVDFDNDTLPDILFTKLGPFRPMLQGLLKDYRPTRVTQQYTPKLYRNQGDGTFKDVSDSAGLIYVHGGMGTNVADVNNDGFMDIYIGTGNPDMARLEPNALYINDGKGGFVDLTRFTGLGHVGKGHGITFADYDFDGDMDIYAPQGGFVHGDLWHNVLYRNEKGNVNNWLQIHLVGTKSNRMGVGAKLTLRAGDLVQYREMTAGGAFGSSSSPYLHFGLALQVKIDSLEITWPSGEKASYKEVPINRFIRIEEGAPDFVVIKRP
jgi:hypothetical protein